MQNRFPGQGEFAPQFGFPPQQPPQQQQQMGGFQQHQMPQQNSNMVGFNTTPQQGFNPHQQQQMQQQPVNPQMGGFNTQSAPEQAPQQMGFNTIPNPLQQSQQFNQNQFQQNPQAQQQGFSQFDGFGQPMQQGQQNQQMIQGQQNQQRMQGQPNQQMMQGQPNQQAMMQGYPNQMMQGQPGQQVMMQGQFGTQPNQQFGIGMQPVDQYGYQQQQQNQVPQASFEAPRPSKLRVKLENSERGVFSAMYTQVDPEENNSVKSEKAMEFFQRSGLDKNVIKNIWLICVPEGDTIDRDGFYIALRLIAYAQNGIEVSEQSVRQNIKSPANPKFGSKNQQNQPPQSFGTTSNSQFSTQSSQITSQPGQFSTQTGSQSGQFNLGDSQMRQTPPQQGSVYNLTTEQSQQFEKFYESIDVNHSGFVTGVQAKQLFTKSQLPKEVLKQIWVLSDQESKGNLSKYQFIVMVHFVQLAKKGIQIPPTLPPNLSQFILTSGKSILQQPIEIPSVQTVPQGNFGGFQNQPNIQNQPPSLVHQSISQNNAQPQVNQFGTFPVAPQIDQQNNSFNQNANPPAKIKDQNDEFSVFQDINVLGGNQQQNPSAQLQQQVLPNQNLILQQQIDTNRQKVAFQPIPQQQQLPINVAPQFEMNISNEQKIQDQGLNQSTLLSQQNNNFDILNQILESYTKTNKKFQDENGLLKEDIKILQDKQLLAIQQLTEIGKNFHLNLQANKQLRQELIKTATDSIQTISSIATEVLQQSHRQNDHQNNHIDQQQAAPGFPNGGFENQNFEISNHFNNSNDPNHANTNPNGQVANQQWEGGFDQNFNQFNNPNQQEQSMQW